MHKANKRCLKFLLLAHLRWPWTLSFSLSLSHLSLASLHSDSRREFAVLARRECVTCTHAASSSPLGCVFYKFSSSKNNERARHVLTGRQPYVALLQRDDALMSARICDVFYCTIKTRERWDERPSNNNNSHVTALARTRTQTPLWEDMETYTYIKGWLSRRCLKDANTRQGIKSACHF
jgi:hypothetical protein